MAAAAAAAAAVAAAGEGEDLAKVPGCLQKTQLSSEAPPQEPALRCACAAGPRGGDRAV